MGTKQIGAPVPWEVFAFTSRNTFTLEKSW